jgi:hypothetical protein
MSLNYLEFRELVATEFFFTLRFHPDQSRVV